jgi:hypothetical protein
VRSALLLHLFQMSKTIPYVFGLIIVGTLAWIAGSHWAQFTPSDYEECSENAARTGRSKDALSILISACDSRFKGRRKLGGGYTVYDARQDASFDIAGPNPNEKELKLIDDAYARHLKLEQEEKRQTYEVLAMLERQSDELEKAKQVTIKMIQVESSIIDCADVVDCEFYKLTVRLNNKSKETVVAVSLGWAFLSEQDWTGCPDSLPTKERQEVILRPGGSTVLNVDNKSDGPNSRKFHYCVKVTDAEIAR